MKFSISTAFYRRGHLVEEIYYQILNQTHTDWEWVVTDDFVYVCFVENFDVFFCLLDVDTIETVNSAQIFDIYGHF